MKALVVYYSATGSTKKIARAIHGGMKKVIKDCDLASIQEIAPEDTAKYGLIGIGSPVWYFRETANVRLFIYNMLRMDGKLCFTFCSHGASPMGIFYSMVPALQKKGLTIIGYKDWYGSVYQVLHAPKPYFTDGHPDEIDMQEAEDFGSEMAWRALRIASGEKQLIPVLPKGAEAVVTFRPHPLGEPFSSSNKKDTGGHQPHPLRKIDRQKCLYPKCKICIDNCPAHSIDFCKSPPVIRKSCINCALCDRLCPTGAIGVDEEILKRSRTMKVINMQKCKFPNCTLCIDHCPMNSIDFSVNPPVFRSNCEGDDLCWIICPEGAIEITNMDLTHAAMYKGTLDEASRKNHPFLRFLAEAEAKGEFRRLVPLDKIGWKNPIYKMKRHPRFNIEELLK